MDGNLTYRADSRIPGDGLILSGFRSSRNPRQNFSKKFARIPHKRPVGCAKSRKGGGKQHRKSPYEIHERRTTC